MQDQSCTSAPKINEDPINALAFSWKAMALIGSFLMGPGPNDCQGIKQAGEIGGEAIINYLRQQERRKISLNPKRNKFRTREFPVILVY